MKTRIKVVEKGDIVTYFPQYKNTIKNDFKRGIFSDLEWWWMFIPLMWFIFIFYVICLPIRLFCWEHFEESYSCMVKFTTLKECHDFIDSQINYDEKKVKIKPITTYIIYPYEKSKIN